MNAKIYTSYALPGGLLALLGLPFYVYFPSWLVLERGFGFSEVAMMFLVARVADALTDIPIGCLVDRLGATKAWFIVGWLALLFGALLLLDARDALMVYIGLILVFVGWSAITVPWMAIPASYPADQHLRFNAAREIALLVGTMLGLLAPTLVGDHLLSSAGLAFVLLMLALCRVPAMLKTVEDDDATVRLGSLVRSVARHGGLRLLLLWWLNALANAVPAVVLVIYVEQVLLAENWLGAFLVMYFVAAVVGAWVLRKPLERYGGRRLWAAACFASALGFLPAYWLGAGDVVGFMLVCVLTGLWFGVESVVAPLIQARVTAEVQATHKGATQGACFGIWTATQKLAMGFAVVVGFGLLGVAPAGDSRAASMGAESIAAIYVAIPVALKLLVSMLLILPRWGGRLESGQKPVLV